MIFVGHEIICPECKKGNIEIIEKDCDFDPDSGYVWDLDVRCKDCSFEWSEYNLIE